MIRRQAGPGLAAMVLMLGVMLCGGFAMGLNGAADRAIATGSTEYSREIARRLKTLPPEERQAVVQACGEEVLDCDPTTRACAERWSMLDEREMTPEKAQVVSALIRCLDRRVVAAPAEPAPVPAPAAEAAELPLPLLAAGAGGGLVVALGALGAFFLLKTR